MSLHVVFLRAINVGGHRVAMAELRGLFEELELSDVETHGASGNVVFGASGSSPDLERRIGEHLERALGYPVAAFVRTLDRLPEIVGRRGQQGLRTREDPPAHRGREELPRACTTDLTRPPTGPGRSTPRRDDVDLCAYLTGVDRGVAR